MIPTASGIYRIRNLLTARVYIGSAVNMAKRRGIHLHQLRHSKHHSVKLQRAWDKAGEGAFVFEVVEIVNDASQLLAREQVWLDETRAWVTGYNCNPTAGSSLGRKFTEETKAKFSAARIGKVRSIEARMRQSEATRGKPKSPEHRAKLAAANKTRGAAATKARLQREAEAKALRVAQRASNAPPPNCVCLTCGKQYRVNPAEAKRGGKFCSRACYYLSKVLPTQTRTCKKCGERFSFPRERDHRYCPPCAGRGSDPLPPELRPGRSKRTAKEIAA